MCYFKCALVSKHKLNTTAALKLNVHESTLNYGKLRHFESDLTSI